MQRIRVIDIWMMFDIAISSRHVKSGGCEDGGGYVATYHSPLYVIGGYKTYVYVVCTTRFSVRTDNGYIISHVASEVRDSGHFCHPVYFHLILSINIKLSEMSNRYYKHVDLDPTKLDAIRLLIIAPDKPGSIIRCSLIHTTLRECRMDIYHSYTALSYVWGSPIASQHIVVNGEAFPIAANLAEVLKDLRDAEAPIRL